MKKNNLQSGFTLVELMVALTLFVIVVMAAVSSLYSVNNASRRVTAMRSVLDNLNFAVESISRTVRTGQNLTCGQMNDQPNCSYALSNGDDSFYVKGTLGQELDIEYRYWSPDGIRGEIQKRSKVPTDSWSAWVPITAPEINIQVAKFYIDGAEATDQLQPSLIMQIEGVASAGADNIAPFSVQTYISQRAAE